MTSSPLEEVSSTKNYFFPVKKAKFHVRKLVLPPPPPGRLSFMYSNLFLTPGKAKFLVPKLLLLLGKAKFHVLKKASGKASTKIYSSFPLGTLRAGVHEKISAQFLSLTTVHGGNK